MPWWDKQSPQPDEPAQPVYDDGGSGLLDACASRFAETGWEFRCDANHAVWVESADATYSVGVAPWMIDRRPLEKILDYVEAKMKEAEARTHG